MRVKVKSQVIATSFLKIEGWGERPEKEGMSVELVGDQNPGPETPSRNKRGRERSEQKKCRGWSDCQRSDGEKVGSGSLRGRDQ